MKAFCSGLLLMVIGMLAACSSLPELQPAPAKQTAAAREACRAVFPQGRWQFTHAIEAAYPGGGRKLLMGVTVVDARARTVDCALMTVEGLVLFQARMGRSLAVSRAVPPFDREGFADGIMSDIRLMFLEPGDAGFNSGRADGQAASGEEIICRYRQPAGTAIDVRPASDAGWRIDRYTPGGQVARTVAGEPDGGQKGFPGRLKLQATGPAGYTLEMQLIEAVNLNE